MDVAHELLEAITADLREKQRGLPLRALLRSLDRPQRDIRSALSILEAEGTVTMVAGRWRLTALSPPQEPKATPSAVPAPKGLEVLRRISAFYADVAHEVASSKLVFELNDEALANEIRAPVNWYELSKGRVSIPRRDLPQHAWKGDERRILCGPMHLVEERGRARRGERRWFPVFMVHLKGHPHMDRIEFTLDGSVQVNLAWLDAHFAVADEDQRDDLLIRLGLLKKTSSGETEPIELTSLSDCWEALQKNVPEFEWTEERSLRNPAAPRELARERRLGLHPRILFLKEELSSFSRGLIKDLRAIAKAEDADLAKSALAALVPEHLDPTPPSEAPRQDSVLVQEAPLNPSQREAVHCGLADRLTVIQGPPGTGKSTVVRSTLLTLGLNEGTALFSSSNHKAVDAVVDPLNGAGAAPDRTLVADLRPQEHNGSWIHLLLEGLDATPRRESSALEDLRTRLGSLDAEIGRYLREGEAIYQLRERLAESHQERLALSKSGGAQWEEHAKVVELPYPTERVRRILEAEQLFVLHPARILTLFPRRKLRRIVREAIGAVPGLDADALASIIAWCCVFQDQASAEAALEGKDDLNDLADRLNEAVGCQQDEVREAYDIFPSAWAGRVRGDGPLITRIRAASRPKGRGNRARLKELGRENLSRLLPGLPLWTTTSKSVNRTVPLVAGAFELAIIDEAGQCDPASVIPVLFRSRRAMFVGDPKQLAPISGLAAHKEEHFRRKHGLGQETFSRFAYAQRSAYDLAYESLVSQGGQRQLLREHYRCHPVIAKFFNNWFYDGELLVRTSASEFRGDNGGLRWTEVEGGSETINGSRWHPQQVDAIVHELELLSDRGFDGTLGVVTPFREHAKRIRDKAYDVLGPRQLEKWSFLSSTADGFQGGEKDVILLGLVGGGDGLQATPPFYLREENRFNVAVSRARLLLNVFGDSGWARTCEVPVLNSLVEACTVPETTSEEVRTELIGPVWEPLLAEKMRARGLEFRQQYPACGGYLDFALFPGGGRKVNIEVDGETYHRDADGNLRSADVRRDLSLKGDGWTVQRFWVYQLREDMSGCLDRISELMETT